MLKISDNIRKETKGLHNEGETSAFFYRTEMERDNKFGCGIAAKRGVRSQQNLAMIRRDDCATGRKNFRG